MKCARCGADSRYRDRGASGICPSCNGRFAFEPRIGDRLSDVGWKSAIDQVSSQGTVRFTRASLYYAIARRWKKKDTRTAGILMLAFGSAVMAGGFAAGSVWGFIGLVVAFIGLALWWSYQRGLALDVPEFERLFQRWIDVHKLPEKLIVPRPPAPAPAPELQHELQSYSFDRAVICDRPDTVDLLLGNDFHFENNCAVLTHDGYPQHAFSTVVTMLKLNPHLEVFALHDATVEGCLLAHRLRTEARWFAGSPVTRIFDVALRPVQAKRFEALYRHEGREVEPHPALTETERRWLGRYSLGLAAILPEQIIKRLFRAMNAMPEAADAHAPGLSDGGGGSDAVFLWTSDATASDGGADSFG